MRVIRTEMYFDSSVVKSKTHERNPGVAAAWFKADVGTLDAHDLFELFSDKYAKIAPEDKSSAVKFFTDMAVQSVRSSEVDEALTSGDWKIANEQIVKFVVNSDILYENSPAEWTHLLSLVAKAGASVTIGTFLGFGVADGNYPLMFLTIPTGIIVIGAAIGVSRGLENGLNKYVENFFKTKGKKTSKEDKEGKKA